MRFPLFGLGGWREKDTGEENKELLQYLEEIPRRSGCHRSTC